MDYIAIPIIIFVIETLWILILKLKNNALQKLIHQLTGYLTGILNNDGLIHESLTTIGLYYGMDPDELAELLERKRNGSK